MTRQLLPISSDRWNLWRASALAALLAALAGCAGEPGASGAEGPSNVSAADFRGPGENATTVLPGPATAEALSAPAQPARRGQPLVVTASAASEGLQDVAVLTGDPRGAVNPAAKPMEAVTLDALVGQINGKPIYAEQFFSALDARLRSIRASTSDQQFDVQSLGLIRQRLMDLLRDELLTAEARAELTPEQRRGLLYYLNQLRDNLASNYGGSREEANARLQEREGRTFEGQVDEELKKQLQASVMRKHVWPRVNVSWRDVLRQFEKEYLSAARESTAVVRMIQIDARNTEGIQSVTEALAAGKPFDEAGNIPANQMPDMPAGRGVFEWPFQGEYTSAKLSRFAVINENAQKLAPGGHTGPFDFKSPRNDDVKVWLKLEEIRTPAAMPLEEVQLKLYNDLFARKWTDEQNKFLLKLMERASYTPLEEMERRLVAIAGERYPSRAGAAIGGGTNRP